MNDYEPHLGLYDMRKDTTGLPESLANKINSSICMKGGGGGGTNITYTGIDPEFKPYLERALADVTARYEGDVAAGPEAVVAGLDPRQEESLALQEQLGRQAATGTGIYDTRAAQQRDLQNLMGTSLGAASGAGSLGSARSQRAMQSALADRSLGMLEKRQQQAMRGVEMMGDVGTTRQKVAQQRLDAPHTSAQRYFGYLSGAPQQQRQETSGGGGK